MADTPKVRLRGEVRRAIAETSPDDRAAWSRAIRARLCDLEAMRGARAVLAYAPAGDEVDVSPVLQDLLDRGAILCLPRIDWQDRTMVPAIVTNLDGLVTGRHGIREPAEDAPVVAPEDLDVILVPGIAFDERCNRLGRGGGFYDRFLSVVPERVLRVGVAFERQVVHSVPMDRHDRPLDAVVTESRILRRA